MKLLLDTHLLLWAVGKPGRLPKQARELIEDKNNDLLFSSASLWEFVVKRATGRHDFLVDGRLLRRALIEHGYGELAIGSNHVLALESFPKLHKDPFDRILVAQAVAEGITLLTADDLVAQYPGPIRKV